MISGEAHRRVKRDVDRRETSRNEALCSTRSSQEQEIYLVSWEIISETN